MVSAPQEKNNLYASYALVMTIMLKNIEMVFGMIHLCITQLMNTKIDKA